MTLVLLLTLMLAGAPAYDDQVREVVRREKAGDISGAMALCRTILEERPHDAGAVLLIAGMMQSKGPPEAVIAFIEAELKIKPSTDATLYTLLGQAQGEVGEMKQAEASFRKGLALAPDDSMLNSLLGSNLTKQRRLKEAEAFITRAAQLDPTWSAPWDLASEVLEKNGKLLESFMARSRALMLGVKDRERGRQIALAMVRLMTATPKKPKGVGNPDDLPLERLSESRSSRENKRLSDGAFFVANFTSLVDSAAATNDRPFLQAATSLFVEARAQGLLEAVAWKILSAARDKEAEAWLGSHPEHREKLNRFLRPG